MTEAPRRLNVRRLETLRPADLSAVSSNAMDADIEGAAELTTAAFADDAVVLGAFQRTRDVAGVSSHVLARRASGGAAACVGRGTLYVALALPHPSALVACDPSRIVNRYVRPLLGALTKVGARATYFDRDWVSVGHRPAALVGFAHDTASRRTLVEAFVCVRGDLVPPGASATRATYRGKAPGSLEEITGRAFDVEALRARVEEAYASAYGLAITRDERARVHANAAEIAVDPPWSATADEAIGVVAAGLDATGRMRVGGELMVSRDALTRLEDALAHLDASPADGALEAAIDALAGPEVALAGVRSLASLLDVITRARGLRGPR